MFGEVKALEQEADQYQEAVKYAVDFNQELTKKLETVNGYGPENLARLDAFVPKTIDEVKILADIAELARKHNLLFGNVSVGDEVDNAVSENDGDTIKDPRQAISYSDIERTTLSFSLIGSYDQFKAFLESIEQSLVAMEVTRIEFVAGEGLLQQFEVTVDLFALPPIEA
jgi:Tfp pilus assembly protein PilO